MFSTLYCRHGKQHPLRPRRYIPVHGKRPRHPSSTSLTSSSAAKSASLTVITTPSNRSFVAGFIGRSNSCSDVITIPFPQGIHRGVESTDKLHSMSLFPTFAISTKLMQPQLELALASIRPFDFLVFDGFLGWTLESANKFGIPRLVFYGISCYASCVCKSVREGKLLARALSDHDPVTLPEFPSIQVAHVTYFE
ncbi:UDP-glycosyltransferase 90A2 [Linum grandiflorum]